MMDPSYFGKGRKHVVKTRDIFIVKGVQFVAVPYPQREILNPYLSAQKSNTDRNISLSAAYADLIRSLMANIN